MVKYKHKKITKKLVLKRGDWHTFSITNSASVQEIECTGIFEFVPGNKRGEFMDEVYRILTDNGKAIITVPYWNSARGIQDYRYEWPPICEQSFLYFNKEWRGVNVPDLKLNCDFDFTYGYAWEPTTAARNDETRAFNSKHYANCIDALQLVLTKRK